MSNDLYQFNFEHDQQQTENQYPISKITLMGLSTSLTYLLLDLLLRSNMTGVKPI